MTEQELVEATKELADTHPVADAYWRDRNHATPWHAEGHMVKDCDGNLVAVARNEDVARLMAMAARMAAQISIECYSYGMGYGMAFGQTSEASWWEEVIGILSEAGRPFIDPSSPDRIRARAAKADKRSDIKSA